MIFFIDRLTVM